MLRIRLFFLIDLLTTGIFSGYAYSERGMDAALEIGLAIFIAFSPICLALASPVVLKLAKRAVEAEQVKLNNLNALLMLAYVDIVAIPLNRFLTSGEYFVTDLVPEGFSQSSLLSYAASAEQNATHPLGKTILDSAERRGLKIQSVSAFHEVPGQGVEALVNGTPLRVGNPDWVTAQGVSASAELLTKADQLSVHGKIPLLLGLGTMARGLIALKDEFKSEVRGFLSVLRRNNIETVILTALNKKTAKSLAKFFDLENLRTNLTPEDKAREVQIYRAQGHNVAVIGNEFHDLPALVNADVSVLLNDNSMVEINENVEIKFDFEIPTLEKFLICREIALRAVNLVKLNRKIAYLSWIVLVPPSMLMLLENSPVPFHPLAAVAGVLIFSVIILINSMRMSKITADKK